MSVHVPGNIQYVQKRVYFINELFKVCMCNYFLKKAIKEADWSTLAGVEYQFDNNMN